MKETAPDPRQVGLFRDMVSGIFGWSFEPDKLGLLTEVLSRRARSCRQSAEGYLTLLRGGPVSELRALAQELTVNETYFFRHGEQMAAFFEAALPRRMAVRGDRPLRFLSAGCSSGEEAYSLAMLARQAGLGPHDFTVLGLDVDPTALQKARAARYTRWSLRETPEDFRRRWFREPGERPSSRREPVYTLDPSIVAAVEFSETNLLSPLAQPWQNRLYDVIFCRNMLMYLAPERARMVVRRLGECLASGGYLFLGHAETLRGLGIDEYDLLSTHGCFYYQRPHAGLASATVWPIAGPVAVTPLPLDWMETIQGASERIRQLGQHRPEAVSGSHLSGLHDIRDLHEQERYAEALDALRSLPENLQNCPETRLLHAVLLLHSSRFQETEELCRHLLAEPAFAAGAHYLLALCREGHGDRQAAAAEHRAATRLDPAFAMPHLHLGRLARRASDLRTARNELEKALLLLQGETLSRLRLYGGGFGREALLTICQSELQACR